MRIGVLGDVHGNLLALEAGHAYVRGIGVDRIVCTGDGAVDGDRTWANAGSIGRPTDGDPRGALLVATLAEGRWHVEIVRLELPLDVICERIWATGMPHAARLRETLRAASWW